ncbi:Thioredoxin-like fold [Pseudocohnilembus persalinus]|uniref:Thioredoxin-like fold n=1 Tax=Pseudocohnilembus persalinus TaxID=266149 RepID=A0A0V0QGM9_PSEPJ|nr:Thioredoxin-like fold [Pseudocohnilembus persalinus]|eukprot:KRX01335.1 Thioredoxin-like fold [Pseudocohnilembus persalinus]
MQSNNHKESTKKKILFIFLLFLVIDIFQNYSHHDIQNKNDHQKQIGENQQENENINLNQIPHDINDSYLQNDQTNNYQKQELNKQENYDQIREQKLREQQQQKIQQQQDIMNQNQQEQDHVLKVTYCVDNFEQVRQTVLRKFPNLQVIGHSHPPTPLNQAISNAFQVIQYAFMGLLIAGDFLFNAFLVGNLIQSQLLQTGAFELFLDDRQFFSKIETGQMPRMEKIIKYLEKNIK